MPCARAGPGATGVSSAVLYHLGAALGEVRSLLCAQQQLCTWEQGRQRGITHCPHHRRFLSAGRKLSPSM